MHFEVVIAGGGFAGAYCARALGKLLGREGETRVALISERNVLVFQPMLAEVAGSTLTPTDVVNPLRVFCRHVSVLQGNIQRIDWGRKELLLDGGRFTRNHSVGFEHLVLALGNVTDLSRVPGMSDYGWPMKTVTDALRLRAALINRLEEANLVEDAVIRARLLTFVVVGGGFTGVETAGQIVDFLKEAKRFYSRLRGAPLRVLLVHSRAHLLEEIGVKLGDYAQGVLEKRGMEIRLNARVAEVTAGKVILADGSFIEAHTVISSIGSAPNPVLLDLYQQLGIPSKNGRIVVDSTLQVPGHPALWSAGDCAEVPWTDRGEVKISPPTAQFALRQGRQLGRNLASVLVGGRAAPFRYRYMGQMATVGERAAVAEVFGFHFSGFFAWWMWRTVYLAKLPGLFRKLRVVIDWTFDLFFPRDISLLLPPPEDVLRAIHLEKGELLFSLGDKCRAFFFLKRGAFILKPAEGSPVVLSAGSVIDQAWLSPDGTWNATASAVESSDAIVFRGKALELIRSNVRLVPRSSAGG